MNRIDEIKRAIRALPAYEREGLTGWLRGLIQRDDRIAERAGTWGNRLSVEDYLALEADARIRHEYLAGEVFAMAGASPRHNRIAVRLVNAFSQHLAGEPCEVYTSDVKVRLKINQDHYFYYPDVMVACEREGAGESYLTSPRLIVEVLSPATEAIDRREKAIHYRWIPALEEYVVVAQDTPEVTVYRRSEGWAQTVLESAQAQVELRSIGLTLALARLYEGESFD